MSMLRTCPVVPARWASSAVEYPEPVPISSTRMPVCRSRRLIRSAMIAGDELCVTSEPSGRSTKAFSCTAATAPATAGASEARPWGIASLLRCGWQWWLDAEQDVVRPVAAVRFAEPQCLAGAFGIEDAQIRKHGDGQQCSECVGVGPQTVVLACRVVALGTSGKQPSGHQIGDRVRQQRFGAVDRGAGGGRDSQARIDDLSRYGAWTAILQCQTERIKSVIVRRAAITPIR